MAVEANIKNTSVICDKHDVGVGMACWPSSRNREQPVFTGHVCGSRARKTVKL